MGEFIFKGAYKVNEYPLHILVFNSVLKHQNKPNSLQGEGIIRNNILFTGRCVYNRGCLEAGGLTSGSCIKFSTYLD